MRRLNGGWRISDMSIDDSSMLSNYQNQFARVISSVGIPGFIEKLKAQLKKIEANDASRKG